MNTPLTIAVALAAAGLVAARPDDTQNKAAALHVDKYQVAASFNGTAAPAGHQFVILDVRWTHVLEPVQGTYIPYDIPDIRTQLQLIVNGESGAKLVNGDFRGPDLLSPESQRIAHGKEVSGRYVFDVRAPVASLELAYFDKVYGNIRIPIMGKAAAPAAGAIAGPATSGGLTLSVLKVDESDAMGDTHAPAGDRFVIITALGSGAATVGDNYLDVDVAELSRLAEADGHLYPASTVSAADDVWAGRMKFVPGTPQRGRVVFLVPAQHGPLAWLVAVPGEPAPMRLPLSAAAAAPPKLPAPALTIADGATATFYLYAVRRTPTGLVLDVGIDNHTGSGIEFQTREQIELLRGDAEVTATDDDLAVLRALPENGVIPPHTSGRWDIPFRVRGDVTGLTLYFRGFETEKKVPLPAVAGK